MAIRTRRAYEPAGPRDGKRYLVDRLWPRGVKKEDLELEAWLPELGPSDALRNWFGHDPSRWEGFRDRYFEELEDKDELFREILAHARRGTVTLVYGARDEEHNQAVALKAFLDRRLPARARKK